MPVQFALNPQILKRVPLFSTFSEQQLSAVLAYVQHRRYPRNALIVRAGDETDALYIILAGRVKVLIQDDEGHEVILSTLGPHDFFGEMGLLDEQPRSASVETLEPCEMLRLSKAGFVTCMKDNFDLAMRIIRNLVKRLRDADRKIESLALIDVYGRVARLLLDMAEEVDGKWVVQHAPPKQEIARMIGASREMVSRVVKDLQEKGLIRAERRKILLLDRQSMTARSTSRSAAG
ncbi:MAG TPA: cyclic nucleotide-binding domain-containing protein [Burkholderiales bacterium]|jgi:CRP/FNR family cyclic AMP-dependent transcriptional regulator|nr:cyclic nucleotide-binding domain-containing protein [Burkholderiales bacterium]HEX6004327.1 cyclic nucleotide-binding domain-containing protein [Burkholderiales bacterium]